MRSTLDQETLESLKERADEIARDRIKQEVRERAEEAAREAADEAYKETFNETFKEAEADPAQPIVRDGCQAQGTHRNACGPTGILVLAGEHRIHAG